MPFPPPWQPVPGLTSATSLPPTVVAAPGLRTLLQFAENGFDLVVNAEDAGIDEAASAVRVNGADVTVVRADQASPSGVQELHAASRRSGDRWTWWRSTRVWVSAEPSWVVTLLPTWSW